MTQANDNGDVWSASEPRIRPLLTSWGYGEEVIDWVFADLKKRAIPTVFPRDLRLDDLCAACLPKVEADVALVTSAFAEVMGFYLQEILRLECDLWVAKFDPPRRPLAAV